MSGPSPEEKLLQRIQFQVICNIGAGAQMPIRREALAEIINHTRGDMTKGFFKGLFKPKGSDGEPLGPGEPRWKRDAPFILRGFHTIGALAAQRALEKGLMAIDKDSLMYAYKDVTAKSSAGGGAQPGDYCPTWP